MVDGCISLAKFDLIVAKKSFKTSAISAAEEIGSLFTLISEVFRTLPYLRELRSSISLHFFSRIHFIHFQVMHKTLFLCRFNGIVCFVSSLLITLPSSGAIFLNSSFRHIVPFVNFASQFTCYPRGVFIGYPFTLKWGMLINYFHK